MLLGATFMLFCVLKLFSCAVVQAIFTGKFYIGKIFVFRVVAFLKGKENINIFEKYSLKVIVSATVSVGGSLMEVL